MTTATVNLLENIHFLVSNVPAKANDNSISVVVMKDELKAGKPYPKFLAFREGKVYDPTNEFKPMNKSGAQKLTDAHIGLFYSLVNDAKTAYDKAKAEFNGTPNNALLETTIKTQQQEIDELKKLLAQPAQPAGKSSAEIELEELKKQFDALKKQLQPAQQIVHEMYAVILRWLKLGRAVYVFGPAGTGKSHIMEQLAIELYGTADKYFVSNAIQDKFSLTGYQDASGTFQPTPFYKAFTEGGLFFIDELDASIPDAAIALNMALAQGHYDFPAVGRVKAHPDFRCVGAGNTVGRGADTEYTGRYVIDQSTLNRFEFVKVTYSPAIEEHLVKGDTELLEFIRDIRRTAEETNTLLLVTYRQITGIVAMGDAQPLEDTLEQALLKGLPADETKQLIRNMSVPASNKYLKALKKLA